MNTVEALGIALAFLMPGALFELGIEREIGFWRTGWADRTLRFLATSAVFQALFAPISFRVWAGQIRDGQLVDGSGLPGSVWILVLALCAVPFATGLLVGWRASREDPWVRFVLGRDPAPRSWDHVFGLRERPGYVRAQIRDGRWVGGVWGTSEEPGILRSFASSYPQAEDLFLADQVELDQVTGALVLDEAGRPRFLGWGLLVERSDIQLLEFQERRGTMDAEGSSP